MIILRQKKFSLFNSFDIYDFFELVEKCNYPNKAKDLKDNTMNSDDTYYWFEKSKVNKKEITNKLKSLESLVSDVLKKHNIPGTTKDWQLYVVSLVGPEKIEIGLENKNGKAFSCEL